MTELLSNLQTATPVLAIMFSSFTGVGIVAAILAYCLERHPKAGAWADKIIGCDYPVDVKPVATTTDLNKSSYKSYDKEN